MKNYDQSNQAKKEFLEKSALAQYMMGDPSRIFLREQLALVFNESDRSIRNKVAEMANYIPVLSLSKDKGYRVLSFNEDTPVEELVKMTEEIQHQINEFKSRIDNLKARMKPLVALQKVIEKKLGN
jgi:hypothetical protein